MGDDLPARRRFAAPSEPALRSRIGRCCLVRHHDVAGAAGETSRKNGLFVRRVSAWIRDFSVFGRVFARTGSAAGLPLRRGDDGAIALRADDIVRALSDLAIGAAGRGEGCIVSWSNRLLFPIVRSLECCNTSSY